jgi:ATP-dependent DNA helicase RecG
VNLSTPVSSLNYVGPILQKKLKKLGIKTVEDLIFHFPHRYEDFSELKKIKQVKIDKINTVRGKITIIENKPVFRRGLTVTEATIEDNTAALKVVWFNQPYLTKTLQEGDEVIVSGKVEVKRGSVVISNPAYEKEGKQTLRASGIVPVYPETEGVSSRWLRFIIKPVINYFHNTWIDPLPSFVVKENNLFPLAKAIEEIHFPSSLKNAEKAKQRFSFEYIYWIQLLILREKARLSEEKSFSISPDTDLMKRFVDTLSFKLTDSQKKAVWRILLDMEKPCPMNRLLEGDVGSGKTIVAVMAALNAAKSGHQVAFMAPTEILAKQHFKGVWKMIQDFNLNIALLTGKEDVYYSRKLKNQKIEISRRKLIEKASQGELSIVIGTHALIQDKVKFDKLALVVLDEQHRFGVEQRAKLCKNKGAIPHLLSMTATPIPRTLALTVYGDLDISLIKELPTGRKKTITEIVKPNDRNKAYSFIKKEVKKERQVFIVCPRIEATEKSEIKAVKEEFERLSKDVFPNLDLAMLHGKMTPKEKEKIMVDFREGKYDILVATSVIEVGIDIPNASVIVIEGAERFGLAQLHQFRGRVGRGKHQSYCFLFTDSTNEKTNQRLRALAESTDGFALAEKDLALRGPGDFTGIRQWGIPDLMMTSLQDLSLVEKTKEAAKQTLMKGLTPAIKRKLKSLSEKIHLE